MAAINAATGRLHEEVRSGIRPFDIGRDLRPVAELIADAFTNELDPRGMAALREMRIMSHLSGLLKLLSRSTGELDDVFSGFVWLEDGKIVGNITVQRADKYGNRWQIANVAVAPAYRGRGIARRLMARALEHIEQSDGRWAVLQVYDHNQVARALYATLGFEEVGGAVDLRLDRAPKVDFPPKRPGFYPFAAHQWQPLYELATAQLNNQAQWWRALRRSDFQMPLEGQIGEWLWRTLGRRRIYRRAILSTRRFEAALILTAQRWRGVHTLELWARPELYGAHESYLLQWALATLQEYPRWPVKMTLNADHTAALEASQEFGFRRLQTLLTMRRKIGEG
ncbi:MAG TPA: GNAT family N-acetyltransferase [Caldilineaceae bacterium]|nr:GNAT family N-acetyltransferase [Caldilineaceae bacterium]